MTSKIIGAIFFILFTIILPAASSAEDTECVGCKTCGDGEFDPLQGEQCDPLIDGANCGAKGTVEECQCPDNMIGDGAGGCRKCDDGSKPSSKDPFECRKRSSSSNSNKCGDGDLSSKEECDDGNTLDGDGCSSACKVVPINLCTDNSILNSGEECVPGTDGCNSDCTCASGRLADGEGRCLRTFCGNDIVDGNDDCDGTANCNECRCTEGFHPDANGICQENEAMCGDGLLEQRKGEECEDGNTRNNDGCSSTCQREICGDGVLSGDEECDYGADFNGQEGVDCSSSCTNIDLTPAEIDEPPEEATENTTCHFRGMPLVSVIFPPEGNATSWVQFMGLADCTFFAPVFLEAGVAGGVWFPEGLEFSPYVLTIKAGGGVTLLDAEEGERDRILDLYLDANINWFQAENEGDPTELIVQIDLGLQTEPIPNLNIRGGITMTLHDPNSVPHWGPGFWFGIGFVIP